MDCAYRHDPRCARLTAKSRFASPNFPFASPHSRSLRNAHNRNISYPLISPVNRPGLFFSTSTRKTKTTRRRLPHIFDPITPFEIPRKRLTLAPVASLSPTATIASPGLSSRPGNSCYIDPAQNFRAFSEYLYDHDFPSSQFGRVELGHSQQSSEKRALVTTSIIAHLSWKQKN
jgi:hypothetical protein